MGGWFIRGLLAIVVMGSPCFAVPNLIGTYEGSYTHHVSNCADSSSDGVYDFSCLLTVSAQTGSAFSAAAVGDVELEGDTYSEYITFAGTVNDAGEITGTTTHTFLGTGGAGTFTGSLAGTTLTILNSGRDTSGETCTYTREFTLTVVGVADPPTVTTAGATGVTTTSATLNGTVNPNGLATTTHFEYGLTTAYGGTAIVTLSPANGTGAQSVSVEISGLLSERTYHYRLTATNAGGASVGADMTFDTPVSSIDSAELVAPKIAVVGGNAELTIQSSVSGRRYQVQESATLVTGSWVDVGAQVIGNGNNLMITIPHEPTMPKRFYRLALDSAPTVLDGFTLIPAGSFEMGDALWTGVYSSDEVPVHTVNVSAFYMAKFEVTKALWDDVRAWGTSNGYTDLPVGEGKAFNHPVHTVSWYDVVKWCNVRSEMEIPPLTPCYRVSGSIYRTGDSDAVTCDWSANGYRLPTEAEWEKAARGGLSGKRFPWGDTITHSQANYNSSDSHDYDVSPTRGWAPTYDDGVYPLTAPVGSFTPNGYGLYDMAGNMSEWCWDQYSWSYYKSSPETDPRGAVSESSRVSRGGTWAVISPGAHRCRVSSRGVVSPSNYEWGRGFRPARSAVP